MPFTMQAHAFREPVIIVYVTLSGATEVTEDMVESWLDGIAAELRAIPDLGVHIAALEEEPFVPSSDTSAVWVRVLVPRAALNDEPFIKEALVQNVLETARYTLRERLHATP